MYWHEFLQLSLGENSCPIKVKNLDQFLGKFLETWEKGWFSFWQAADKLESGSVFGKVLINLEESLEE